MQKNLSKFAACLLAFGFSGVCQAGEGASQRSMSASLAATQITQAKAAEAQPLPAPPKQTSYAADWLGDELGDGGTVVTALLGLGLLVTVVYRAKT